MSEGLKSGGASCNVGAKNLLGVGAIIKDGAKILGDLRPKPPPPFPTFPVYMCMIISFETFHVESCTILSFNSLN